ncbi:MAG TPA: bifunctional riboflavin kinase/FAD synthetase [Lachnospiraceae bacterium]|nr:bifunctional riboflavin kinase/FAD synthetase [Lachnospiraceae bacterium]
MMNITNTIDFHIEEETAVAIGKFDGIHKGHEKILQELLARKSKGLKTVVFTFDTPPTSVFYGKNQKVLTTNAEKRAMLESFGVDYLIEFPFYEETAAISAEAFIEDILVNRLHMKAIIAGTDCRFGHKGLGDRVLLQKYGELYQYETVIVTKELYQGQEISSSFIRGEIESGSMELANEMLMMPYSLIGEVVHGRKFGRTLGMPTVNLIPEEHKLLPPNGVYLSKVSCNGVLYDGITNIGCKPTVDGDIKNGVETYIYQFHQDVYGDVVVVSLLEYQRPEMKFPSVEDLKQQMQSDIVSGEQWHTKYRKKYEKFVEMPCKFVHLPLK